MLVFFPGECLFFSSSAGISNEKPRRPVKNKTILSPMNIKMREAWDIDDQKTEQRKKINKNTYTPP